MPFLMQNLHHNFRNLFPDFVICLYKEGHFLVNVLQPDAFQDTTISSMRNNFGIEVFHLLLFLFLLFHCIFISFKEKRTRLKKNLHNIVKV